MTYTLFETSAVAKGPRARWSDPVTSQEAAEKVRRGNGDLVKLIRGVVAAFEPVDAFRIAVEVEKLWPGRWSEATTRTAIARAGLRAVDTEGRSPRGQRCIRYSL